MVLQSAASARSSGLLPFFVLACVITWLLDLPMVLAFLAGAPLPDHALPMVGLGAFGPTLAAFVVAYWRRELGQVFGRWRTDPIWVVVGLLFPLVMHLPATLLEVALDGEPAQFFYFPKAPERIAALVFFSVGEEFGWRGFAYPRVATRYGPIVGSLLLGAVWGIWHLGMMFTAETGAPSTFTIGYVIVELALSSVVVAWIFEKGNRSMLVAFACHAGGHLDNVNLAPESEIRLRILRFVMLVVFAALAARALSKPSATGGAGLANAA